MITEIHLPTTAGSSGDGLHWKIICHTRLARLIPLAVCVIKTAPFLARNEGAIFLQCGFAG